MWYSFVCMYWNCILYHFMCINSYHTHCPFVFKYSHCIYCRCVCVNIYYMYVLFCIYNRLRVLRIFNRRFPLCRSPFQKSPTKETYILQKRPILLRLLLIIAILYGPYAFLIAGSHCVGLFCTTALQKRPIFCKRDLRFQRAY